ncbi:MAG: helix-turn-helix domain-containing protein [Frankia sp.]
MHGTLESGTETSSALRLQRLRDELQEERRRAHLTQKDVAAVMDCSPSKIHRIEAGEVAVSRTDLQALLTCYGVTDEKRVAELSLLARRKNTKASSDAHN